MTLWIGKIRFSLIHSKLSHVVWDWSGGVFRVYKHLFHDIGPSGNHSKKVSKKSKSGLKIDFLQAKMDFACQNAFLVEIQKLTTGSPSILAIRTNPCSQSNFGWLSKTSRDRFFISFLFFEKNNFFSLSCLRSHPNWLWLTYLWSQKWLCGLVKFDFLWFISNFPKWCGIGLGCLPGLQTSFPWYWTI